MHERGLSDDLSLDGRTVLFVVPDLAEGPLGRRTLASVTAVSDAGGRALVAAGKGDLLGEMQAAGGEWIDLPLDTANPLRSAANVSSLAARIDREAVDAVHLGGAGPGWTTWAAARLARRPLVAHLDEEPTGGAATRADCILVPSTYLADRLQKRFGVRYSALRMVSPGLALDAFDPGGVSETAMAGFRTAAAVPPSGRLVVQWGPFSADQGQILLIDAVRLLVNGGLKGVSFALVPDGDGPDREALEARIEAQGVGHVVRIVEAAGPVALAAADLAVVTPVEPQAVARQALQAIAAGAVTIGGRIGAVPEVLRSPPDFAADRATGLLVPPGDALPLAEGIARALNLGMAEMAAISARARRHAAKFTLARLQDDLVKALGASIVARTG